MLDPLMPALVLAPMDGITDAPMRAYMGSLGAFSWAVSEFLRVSNTPIPAKVFRRDVPELLAGGTTSTGMPVQVQILGGHPERMAQSAQNAVKAGATAIDINFGCPAPTVNRNDGGASILREPCRIREIVRTVREALPAEIPVSAKLRLGWDSIDAIYENAAMAVEGGASWLTIHARTKAQGYAPPVFWGSIGRVRALVEIPVIANGDIRSLDDFWRCRDETGCSHFMIGRGALANPALPGQIAAELGLNEVGANPLPLGRGSVNEQNTGVGLCEASVLPHPLIPSPRGGAEATFPWIEVFNDFVEFSRDSGSNLGVGLLGRLKQWAKIAYAFGDFPLFHEVKHATSVAEFFGALQTQRLAATA